MAKPTVSMPNWQAVYYYFDKWKTNGLLEKINLALNKLDRKSQGREEYPSILCIDSQSVKLSPRRPLDLYNEIIPIFSSLW